MDFGGRRGPIMRLGMCFCLEAVEKSKRQKETGGRGGLRQLGEGESELVKFRQQNTSSSRIA